MNDSNASGRALLDDSSAFKRTHRDSIEFKKNLNSLLSTGEQFHHDPQFRGPLARRSCTDVICLMLFFVFLIAFGFAGYYGEKKIRRKVQTINQS